MRLNGRRESSNVEDRRGQGGGMFGGKAGMGIIVALIIGVASYFGINVSESDLGNVIGTVTNSSGAGSSKDGKYQESPEEKKMAKFAKQVFASTEDVWTAEFKKMGKVYEPPKLVLFSGGVQSGCGSASSSTGPFYCSADQRVYIDLSFFMNMKKSLGADGDFAYAYVIAHEVGHHVQNLLGTLGRAHQKMSKLSEKEANKISVMLELQADNYAGVWAYHENKMFKSLEEGDLDEAINVASKIGDDYLQKKAQGYAVPESFNHGTSQQRMKWLKRGFMTGDIAKGNTFDYDYSEL